MAEPERWMQDEWYEGIYDRLISDDTSADMEPPFGMPAVEVPVTLVVPIRNGGFSGRSQCPNLFFFIGLPIGERQSADIEPNAEFGGRTFFADVPRLFREKYSSPSVSPDRERTRKRFRPVFKGNLESIVIPAPFPGSSDFSASPGSINRVSLSIILSFPGYPKKPHTARGVP
jgi:hypothetical protein